MLADLILDYVPLPSLPYHLTHYVRGATPLSTQPVVVSVLVGYLATVFSIQALMKNSQPFNPRFLFQLHNLVLTSGSLLLLVLMLEEILPILYKNGLFYAMCNNEAWTEVRTRWHCIPCAFLLTLFAFSRAAPRALLYDQLLLQVP
jgi:fatty acid elongase 3